MSQRMYVIGDVETGIVFVRLNPVRVAVMSHDDIDAFAVAQHTTSDKVRAMISKAAQNWIMKTAEVPAINRAEFCYVADLRDTAWQENRNPYPPVKDGLVFLAKNDPATQTVFHDVTLSSTADELMTMLASLANDAGEEGAEGVA